MNQEPVTPTTCNHCGKHFNTSRQHPARYCSIACEEGRAPVAESDPQSPNYWAHVQGNPQSLIGRALVADGLKRTCYSPDWHRDPSDYNSHLIVEHDPYHEILVYETSVFIGEVADWENGQFKIRYTNEDGSLSQYRWHDESTVVGQLKSGNWWAE